jgi:large subunit ribosomal protein L9
MRNVEILLRDHVEHLGRCGEVVRVRPGYARNYLFPRNLATLANEENKQLMARKAKKLAVLEAAHAAERAERAKALEGLTLRTRSKADAEGHLYGSVNAAQIAALAREQGHALADKDVRLDGPIKQIGTHKVKLHLHGDQYVEIAVAVERE